MTSLAKKSLSFVSSLVVMLWVLFFYFKILEHIEATELMWFLFWVYVPLSVFSIAVSKFIADEVD
ncbi:MAG: hypothetical protein ACOC1X_02025 [Promethearchaeota archaeon]